jgi:hypothetical protein
MKPSATPCTLQAEVCGSAKLSPCEQTLLIVSFSTAAWQLNHDGVLSDLLLRMNTQIVKDAYAGC